MDADEVFDGTVVCALRLRWEEAARQLPHLPMVADTLTAPAFPRAGRRAAGTFCQVPLYVAFHGTHLRQDSTSVQRKYSIEGHKAKGHQPMLMASPSDDRSPWESTHQWSYAARGIRPQRRLS